MYLDSSFRSKMALVEVDLVAEKVVKWETQTNFDNRPELQSNKMYNFGDLNNYLRERFMSKGNSLLGGLVLCFEKNSTLVLLGTVKKFNKINSNNSELNFIFYINYSSLQWKAILKSENHSYEESGQVMKFSKVYVSQGKKPRVTPDKLTREKIPSLEKIDRESVNGVLDRVIEDYFEQIESLPNLSKTFTEFIRRQSAMNKTNFDWGKTMDSSHQT